MEKTYHIISRAALSLNVFLLLNSAGALHAQTTPPAFNSSTRVNYTRTYKVKAPVQSVSQLATRPVTDMVQTTQYTDGLGRPWQKVTMQTSPQKRDVATPYVYDNMGRQQSRYLSFSSNVAQAGDVSGDGNFKLDPFQQDSVFNAAQFPGQTYFYSQTKYEKSPLGRPVSFSPPGNNWTGSSRGVSLQYQINQSPDSVQLWAMAPGLDSFPINKGMYTANQLTKNVTTDENGHMTVEYRDKEGTLMLLKKQLAVSPGPAHIGWLCTYYVYDTLRNLRFIISPKAVEVINNTTTNWVINSSIANELCYRYEYDGRNRLIIKRTPGAGPAWIVYDSRNRIVMTQDSNMRASGKWAVTEYDSQNRPYRSGLLTDAHNRAYHQTLAAHSSSYPNTSANYEVLSQVYFDDYSWASGAGLSGTLISTYTSNSTYFITSYNTSPYYAQQIIASYQTRGMMTGAKTKVLGTVNQYLYSAMIYDDHQRVIQIQSTNYTGGVDTTTVQYDFSGHVLRSLANHQKSGNTVQNHMLLTKLNYDSTGRLKAIWKNIDNASSDQLIDSVQYNELGQVRAKYLGNGLDSLVYDYNIRGWLTGINKKYVAGTATDYFGMELAFDNTSSVAPGNTYTTPEYNGEVGGTVWKSAGSGINRKYDFTYDNDDRLTSAAFLQNTTGSAWDKTQIDFSVNGLSYDANGNILTMTQRGFTVGGSSAVDSLVYSYSANSNKLTGVIDNANNPTSLLGDFHYNTGSKGATDFAYDGNGNLTQDNNKAIGLIHNDVLNLQDSVAFTSKGYIKYIYSASGTKLQKITVDNIASKKTVTTYIGSFIYQATSAIASMGTDTLQFITHEEGRARWAYHKYTNGATAYMFEYDFYEKDHLGNVRTVLSQQRDTANYLASMEAAYRTTESQLFANIAASCYPKASVSGYPVDNTTTPNDSLARLNGSGQKAGPSLLLKVMSGDQVQMAVKSFYQTGTNATQNSSFSDILNSLANGLVNTTGGAHGTSGTFTSSGSSVYSGLTSFLTNDDPNTTSSYPKAYLNWIFLDDQFNYVSSLSGAVQAASSTYPAATLNTVAPGSALNINRNGYLYIWVSNETQSWDVFFDNLSVQHRQGPLLEESHYYPFGLTMAGISDRAIKTNYAENKYKYNEGTELQNKEFSDGSGLELYETSFRSLDPQLGRFWQIDPLADQYHFTSPYQYALNNPLVFNDPSGAWDEEEVAPPKKDGGSGDENDSGGDDSGGDDGGGEGNAGDGGPGDEQGPANNSNQSPITPPFTNPDTNKLLNDLWMNTPDNTTATYNSADNSADVGPNGMQITSTHYNYVNGSGTAAFSTDTYHNFVTHTEGEDYIYAGTTTTILVDFSKWTGTGESEGEEKDGWEMAVQVNETLAVTTELTNKTVEGATKLAEGASGVKIPTVELPYSKLLGVGFGVINISLTVRNGVENGWENHHTADILLSSGEIALGLFEATSPIGWAVGLGMFVGNMISQHYTGHTITENLFDKH